jgi:hypothetical protein
MITEIDARRFGKLTGSIPQIDSLFQLCLLRRPLWMTLDRQRLGVVELQDAVQWRATVFDRDTGGLYVPEHYKDIWGTQNDATERLIEMLLAEPGPACGCALCISELEWRWELARRNFLRPYEHRTTTVQPAKL